MKSLRKFAPALAVLALLVLSPLSRAQALKEVPSDALVVVEFNKIKATSDKLGALAKKLALTEIKPEFGDPLASMKEKAGISKGLNDNGDIAIVLLNESMQEKDPPLLLMLPVTDYAAFISNFADAKATGEITQMHFPSTDTDESYVAHWGDYAVIASKAEQLTRKDKGLAIEGKAAGEVQGKDIVAYVNVKSARNRILPAMTKARGEFMSQMNRLNGTAQAGAPGVDAPAPGAEAAAKPKISPMAEAVVGRLFDIAQQVVTDANALTYGVGLDDDGMKFTALAEFIPDSPSAQKVAQLKGSDASFLAGLPQEKYLFFGGLEMNPQLLSEAMTYFMEPMQKQSAGGPDAAKLQEYMDGLKQFLTSLHGQNFGLLVPTGALGQESMFQMLGIIHGDAKAILAGQQKLMQNQQAFMDMINSTPGAPQAKVTFTENAKTIDGISLNKTQTQFVPGQGQQTPQQMQIQQMMTFLYGPEGINQYTGMVDDKTVVVGGGVSDAALGALVASAKSNQDVLSQTPGVQAVAKNLPQTRFFAGYFALDQFVGTLANYAKAFGLPINLQLPADLPPIGLSASADGSAVQFDSYVPTQLVQSIVAAGMQAKMQMQGGQAPGGAGGL